MATSIPLDIPALSRQILARPQPVDCSTCSRSKQLPWDCQRGLRALLWLWLLTVVAVRSSLLEKREQGNPSAGGCARKELPTLRHSKAPVAIPYLGNHDVTLWNTWELVGPPWGYSLHLVSSLGQILMNYQSSRSRGRLGWAYSNTDSHKAAALNCLASDICFIFFLPHFNSRNLRCTTTHPHPFRGEDQEFCETKKALTFCLT